MEEDNDAPFHSKKKKLVCISSSDDDDIQSHLKTPKNCRNSCRAGSTRSSERIKKRQNRTFSLPSREERWKNIPSDKHPEKDIARLTPKKLINNFTKESHRYNYDPVYTSGEESMEEFINDGSDSTSSDTKLKKTTKKGKLGRKVKYYHPRIVHESSSDSEDDSIPTKPAHDTDSGTESDVCFKPRRKSVKRNSKCIESESEEDTSQNKIKPLHNKQISKSLNTKLENYEEDTDNEIPFVDRRRSNIIDSDDSGTSDKETNTEQNVNNANLGTCKCTGSFDGNINSSGDRLLTDGAAVILSDKDCKIDTSKPEVVGNSSNTENIKTVISASSNAEITNVANAAEEMDSELVDVICKSDENWESSEEINSSDSADDESDDSESEPQVKSDRTRVMLEKKKKKKEKLFEKFREARQKKLQSERKKRLSETHNQSRHDSL